MADVDAIAKLLEVGLNAVFLWMLWRVYQDFIRFIHARNAYLEKLVDRLLEDDEPPPSARAYPPPPPMYSTRTPTELADVRAGAD